jgi:hypothetical protein
MDMHRRAVATLVAVACTMIGSGAVAVAALAGGDGPAADQNAPQPTAPETSVVIERLFDDTYVVLGTTPSPVVTTSRPKAPATPRAVETDSAPPVVTSTAQPPTPTSAPTAKAPITPATTTTARATTTTQPPTTTARATTTTQPPTTTTVGPRPKDDD